MVKHAKKAVPVFCQLMMGHDISSHSHSHKDYYLTIFLFLNDVIRTSFTLHSAITYSTVCLNYMIVRLTHS